MARYIIDLVTSHQITSFVYFSCSKLISGNVPRIFSCTVCQQSSSGDGIVIAVTNRAAQPCLVWTNCGHRKMATLKTITRFHEEERPLGFQPVLLCSWMCNQRNISFRDPDQLALRFIHFFLIACTSIDIKKIHEGSFTVLMQKALIFFVSSTSIY